MIGCQVKSQTVKVRLSITDHLHAFTPVPQPLGSAVPSVKYRCGKYQHQKYSGVEEYNYTYSKFSSVVIISATTTMIISISPAVAQQAKHSFKNNCFSQKP